MTEVESKNKELREAIATAAMQGIIAVPSDLSKEAIADKAVDYADALIERLEQ